MRKGRPDAADRTDEWVNPDELIFIYVTINGQRHRLIFASKREGENFLAALGNTDSRWTVSAS